MTDTDETVRNLLALHGIAPDTEEVAELRAGYATARSLMERLYQVEGVRYEDPALAFDPRQ
jgi:hypothetical protein